MGCIDYKDQSKVEFGQMDTYKVQMPRIEIWNPMYYKIVFKMPLIILLGSVWLGRKQEEEKIGEKKKKKKCLEREEGESKIDGAHKFSP